MMLAAVQDYRRIWDVAAVRRMPGMFKFLTGLLLLTVVVAAFLDQMGDKFGLPAHFGVAGMGRALLVVAGSMLDLLWSTVFMPGSILLNSAANARLLPRQRRRLLQMAVGGWVLGNLMVALGVEQPGVFPLAALWSLTLGLSVSGQRWAMPVSMFLPLLSTPVLSYLPQPVRDALMSPAGALAAGVLVVACGWHLLKAQYVDGGDRLLERSEALAQQARRMESKGEVKDSLLTSWSYRFAYLPALRQACRRRDPSALLLHAMGPWSHWSMMGSLTLIAIITMAFVTFLPQLAKGVHPREGGFADAGLIMLAMIPVAVAFSTFPLRQQIGKRQGEQALLRLAPLTGNADLLNHRLADGLLKTAAQHWLILGLPYCLLALGLGGAEALARELALCCLGGQVALAIVIDDFSRPPRRGWLWRLLALAAAELAVTVGLGAWLGFSGWPWLAALGIVAGTVQAVQGWRRLRSAPPAFPALRFDTDMETGK